MAMREVVTEQIAHRGLEIMPLVNVMHVMQYTLFYNSSDDFFALVLNYDPLWCATSYREGHFSTQDDGKVRSSLLHVSPEQYFAKSIA